MRLLLLWRAVVGEYRALVVERWNSPRSCRLHRSEWHEVLFKQVAICGFLPSVVLVQIAALIVYTMIVARV